jgi:hypothetical protein
MLTSQQLTTLRADLAGRPELAALVQTAEDAAIAAFYNQPATPDFWVWKSAVTREDVQGRPSDDGTLWDWPAFVARSQGERDAWVEMFRGGNVNPSLANVRTGIAAIFSGSTNNAPAQRAHLLAIARRKATWAEKLLASGAGSTASPATLGFEGQISVADAGAAR